MLLCHFSYFYIQLDIISEVPFLVCQLFFSWDFVFFLLCSSSFYSRDKAPSWTYMLQLCSFPLWFILYWDVYLFILTLILTNEQKSSVYFRPICHFLFKACFFFCLILNKYYPHSQLLKYLTFYSLEALLF